MVWEAVERAASIFSYVRVGSNIGSSPGRIDCPILELEGKKSGAEVEAHLAESMTRGLVLFPRPGS